MARRRLHLLIIDPQNDFCDLPADYCPISPDGSRFVTALPIIGAHADMLRLAKLIDTGGEGLDAVTVTLDSHQYLDISHPGFWQGPAGIPIAPFTKITATDLRTGNFQPRVPQIRERTQGYLDALEATGRIHIVWPVHCEIGTWGHNIHHYLHLACNRWEEARNMIVAKVSKGENPMTEHYSAMMAEVPDATDPATQFNLPLFERLRAADCVYIAGEAGSHCVKATVEHIVARWPANELSQLTLIEDCISPVSGFEAIHTEFLTVMRTRGVRIVAVDDVCEELLNNK